MNPKRLVHLTTTDMSLSLLLGPQLQAFQAAGYEVIGVSAPGPYVAQLEANGIRHIALENATRSMALAKDAAALIELVRLFRKLRPTIVHTHNPKPGVYGRVAAAIARVPVIVNTVHGLYAVPEDPLAKRAVVYSLERIAAACSQAELLQNVEDLPVLLRLGVSRSKLQVLGNGIDLQRFDAVEGGEHRAEVRRALGWRDDEVIVGCVGRLVWEKGYREVFDAARALRTAAPHVRIVVVGPTDFDKADAITAPDIAAVESIGNVSFLGHRDDVERLYPAFDAYLLASYREGFPRSAMEAAAMGCPIVATDIRGCRQVVDDGVTGVLVPVHDAGAIAHALTVLAADAGARRALGAAARRKAIEEFDQQRVIDITLRTYRHLEAVRGVA